MLAPPGRAAIVGQDRNRATPRDVADARLNEVTAAGLLGWSKGKDVKPLASSPESASWPSSPSVTCPAC